MIPYAKQDISQEDIDAVINVLKSDFLTQGPLVPLFEDTVKNHVGADYAVAVNSATSALHIACLSLELGPDDWLWTSPISFVASANCGLYCGANIDFVDIDPSTYNLCPKSLEEKLILAKKAGKLPKIIILVHFSGQSCDMESIYSLSKDYDFKIIEDASHAIGGKYKGEYIGNCKFSEITVFSFHPVKIITTAEGGMALTNDLNLAKKMNLYRSHGVTRDQNLMTKVPDGPWYYQQIELGFNYRMTELQAGLGLSQLKRLDQFVLRRHELAKQYDQFLSELPVVTPLQHPYNYSALHLYVIRLKLNEINKSHKEVFEGLRSHGIGVNLHYIPIHTQPYFKKMGFKKNQFVEAEKYYKEAISLPLHTSLSFLDQERLVQTLKEIIT